MRSEGRQGRSHSDVRWGEIDGQRGRSSRSERLRRGGVRRAEVAAVTLVVFLGGGVTRLKGNFWLGTGWYVIARG